MLALATIYLNSRTSRIQIKQLEPSMLKVMNGGNRNANLQTPTHSCHFSLPLSQAAIMQSGDRAGAGRAQTLVKYRHGSESSFAKILFMISNQLANASKPIPLFVSVSPSFPVSLPLLPCLLSLRLIFSKAEALSFLKDKSFRKDIL